VDGVCVILSRADGEGPPAVGGFLAALGMTLELIDVLTAEGAPVGIAKTKAEVHRDGDWHRAAHVWIVASDGRLLLQRRSLRKENYPSLWDVSAAGHLSAGETSKECAVRETSHSCVSCRATSSCCIPRSTR